MIMASFIITNHYNSLGIVTNILVGNVGDMSGRVGAMPTLSAKNRPTSNVANAETEFMAGSCVWEP